MSKIKKKTFFFCLIFIKKFFFQKLKNLFPSSCLKFIKDYSENIFK